MLLGLGAALVAAVLFGTAAILQAIASRRLPPSSALSPRLALDLLREPTFLVALGLNVTGFGFHLVALRSIPLFLAQSGIAASLAVTALLAVKVFHDELGRRDWFAVAAVCLGLALMASSAGSVGNENASGGFVTGVFAALVTVALAGLAATRHHGVAATEALGVFAGFGFAGVGITARILPNLSPPALVTSPASYALLLSGGLAFGLYSLALQRGSVTGATAPMIVTQTVTPAFVGVLLLGDQVRSGWIAIAALGFVVTGVGAVVLARFESVTGQDA